VNRTILVVDDDDDAREVTALSLQTVAGWNVIEAYCGAQGIESAKLNQPDAILLDVMMPAMDGPAILQKLKTARSTAHIPVVLLTAKARPGERKSLSNLPVEAILIKPFDPLKLANEVADALGWSRSETLSRSGSDTLKWSGGRSDALGRSGSDALRRSGGNAVT
jgi:CheY-like chemotaxis protein